MARRPQRKPDVQRALYVVDQHQSSRASLRNGMVKAILSVLKMLAVGALDRDAAVDQVRALVDATRQNSADLAWAYLDQLGDVKVKGHVDVDPWEDESVLEELVDAGPSQGAPAVLKLLEDALDAPEQDAMEAHGGADDQVIGFRRVVHPELSEGGVCGLCVIAATRVYSKGNLKKIHGGCKCTVAEVTVTSDVGHEINGLDLGAVYTDAGGSSAEEASKVRYRKNPQTGVLERYADPKQRNPENDDKPIVKQKPKAPKRSSDYYDIRITVLEKEVRSLEARAAKGEKVDLQLASAKARLKKLRDDAARAAA